MPEHDAEHSAPEKKPTPPHKKPHTMVVPSFVVVIPLLLISALVLSGIGYGWYRLQHKGMYRAEIQSEMAQLKQVIAHVQETMQRQAHTIDAHQAQLQKIGGGDGDSAASDWRLAKAAHLIQLAHYDLTYQKNVSVAMALLTQADNVLKGLPSSVAHRMRDAITADLQLLRAVSVVDVDDTLMKIETLQQKIVALPVIPVGIKNKTDAGADKSDAKKTNGMVRAWHAIVRSFKGAVVVHHEQEDTLPLIAVQEKTYLIENIRSQLNLAAWSVMRGKDALYHASLSGADAWVRRYFVADAGVTQDVLKAIAALQAVTLTSDLPDLGASLKAIGADTTRQGGA